MPCEARRPHQHHPCDVDRPHVVHVAPHLHSMVQPWVHRSRLVGALILAELMPSNFGYSNRRQSAETATQDPRHTCIGRITHLKEPQSARIG